MKSSLMDIRNTFHLFDQSGDGYVTHEEINDLLEMYDARQDPYKRMTHINV